MSKNINEILSRQKKFFRTGATRSIDFRILQLERLHSMLEEHETAIIEALRRDMGKPPVEAYSSEIGMLLAEIRFVKKHLRRWSRPQSVRTMLFHMPASSSIIREPYGVVCIIGPWNYPFQLILSPLTGALAAGNCAVLKPSESAPYSTALLSEMIQKYFDEEYIAVITGNADDASVLVRQPLDYIFFTGSSTTGKKILEAAAANLVPCTLELGGKNVCIVDRNTDIPKTAKRIAWGKFFNAGQTCVAPDYVTVSRDVEDQLKRELINVLKSFYGDRSNDYARIINPYHFNRLLSLMENCHIAYGGKNNRDTLWIEPTLIDHVSFSDTVMSEEIFGPILPIISFDNLSDLLSTLQLKPKPLAMYVFSKNRHTIDRIIKTLSAGTVCINGTFSQMISFTLPFGGVGMSGMGRYHGFHSFQTFTHEKAVLRKSLLFDTRFMYPPYKVALSLIKKFMRVLFKHV